jgi:hypothetical protein
MVRLLVVGREVQVLIAILAHGEEDVEDRSAVVEAYESCRRFRSIIVFP